MSEPFPVEVRAPRGARVLEIVWEDGSTTRYRHQHLRGFCPCAGCQGHQGPIRWTAGTDQLVDAGLELTGIEEVGSYAIQLAWGDGHSSGIYSFRFLKELAPVYGHPEPMIRELGFGR